MHLYLYGLPLAKMTIYTFTSRSSASFWRIYQLRLIIICCSFLCVLSCSKANTEKFNTLLKQGDTFFDQKDYENALTTWNKAYSVEPTANYLLRRIGNAHLRLANLTMAVDAYTKFLQFFPQYYDVRLEVGKIYLLLGKFDEAKAYIKDLKKDFKQLPDPHVLLGDLMLVYHKYEDAEYNYRKALKLKPTFQPAAAKLMSCLYAQNKTDAAEKQYQALLSLKPNTPEILVQIGNFWNLKGDYRTAEKFFFQAIELSPEDVGLKKMLADFYFYQQEFQHAETLLRYALEIAPDSKYLTHMLIEVLLSQHKLTEAHAILMPLFKENDEDVELHLLKGKYHLLNMEYINAVVHFKFAVSKNTNLYLAHYLLGVAYLAGGKNQLARQSLQKVLMLNHTFTDAELLMADFYYKTDELDLGLEHADRIINREPNNFRAHLIRGNILLAQKNYTEALHEFDIAEKISPGSLQALYYQAFAKEKLKHFDEALEMYLIMLVQHPNNADIAQRYFSVVSETSGKPIAINNLKELIKQTPDNSYLYHLLGTAYFTENNLDLAQGYYQKSIEINPGLVSSYLRLADIYNRIDQAGKQIDILEKCIQMAPNFTNPYDRLAHLYLQNRQPEKAISTIEAAQKINPDLPLLSANLAYLYLEYGEDEMLIKAFDLARKAYEQQPNHPAIADTMGLAYLKKKHLDQAIWYFTEAKQKNPDHPVIHFHLGYAFFEKKDTAYALKHLDRALKLNVPSPYKEKAEQLIKALKSA